MSGYNGAEFAKMANDTLVRMLGSQEAVDKFTREFYSAFGSMEVQGTEPGHSESESKLTQAEKRERVERRMGCR